MAKVITLARTFMKDHPRAGEPTYFVEKVLNSLGIDYRYSHYVELLTELNWDKFSKGELTHFWHNLYPNIESSKPHTIRNGHRFKQGEKASLRVWSGKPYNSPQIIIAPDVEIKKVYDFKIQKDLDGLFWTDIGTSYYHREDMNINMSILPIVAKNDGLSWPDFRDWFKFPSVFDGQIICWRDPGY